MSQTLATGVEHTTTDNYYLGTTTTHKAQEMKSTLDMVQEFEIAFGRVVKDSPDLSDDELNLLRFKLLIEEVDELRCAMAEKDKVAAMDALCDIQYILDGTFLELGFWKNKMLAFTEVHNSNMSKLEDGKPLYREDGKILKGSKYRPPQLEMFV